MVDLSVSRYPLNRANQRKRGLSPVVAIAVTQVVAWAFIGSEIDASQGFVFEDGARNDVRDLIGIAVFAPLGILGGAGYAVYLSGHPNLIQRTLLAAGSYLVTLSIAAFLLMIIDTFWMVMAPSVAAGAMLAIALREATSARNWFRFALPSLAGAFVVSLRQIAEAYWAIPTPDWTLTIVESLMIGFYAVSKLEASRWHPLRFPDER